MQFNCETFYALSINLVKNTISSLNLFIREKNNVYMFELVYADLCLVKTKGIVNLIVQIDLEVILRSFKRENVGSSTGWSIVKRIRKFISKD